MSTNYRLYDLQLAILASLKLRIFEVFKHVGVVFFLPLFICVVDPLLHLVKSTLKHGCELLTHLVNLFLEPDDFFLFLLLYGLLLLLQLPKVLCKQLDCVVVGVDLPLKKFVLLGELLKA